MHQTYKYNDEIYKGQGEGFLYGNPNSALSFFRYPNSNKLKGIGLHYHPECDDIDILIEGRLKFYSTSTEYKLIKAPAVVANPSGAIHSVISVDDERALMFGFRSPFGGGVPIKPKKFKVEGFAGPKSLVFDPKQFLMGSHLILKTKYTDLYLHKFISLVRLNNRPVGHNRVLINLSAEKITVMSAGRKSLMDKKSIVYENNLVPIILEVSSQSPMMVLELIAKETFNEKKNSRGL